MSLLPSVHSCIKKIQKSKEKRKNNYARTTENQHCATGCLNAATSHLGPAPASRVVGYGHILYSYFYFIFCFILSLHAATCRIMNVLVWGGGVSGRGRVRHTAAQRRRNHHRDHQPRGRFVGGDDGAKGGRTASSTLNRVPLRPSDPRRSVRLCSPDWGLGQDAMAPHAAMSAPHPRPPRVRAPPWNGYVASSTTWWLVVAGANGSRLCCR